MTTNRAFRQLRRALPPLRVAYRRTGARLGPVVLVAIGIGLAAGALAAILTARVVVADRAVADAIAAFPPDQRSVTVSWIGTETASLSTLDREARRTVDSFGMGQPTRAVVYRTTRIGSENVRVAALDDLDDLVDLRSGRAPEPCSARSCQLVALDAPARPLEASGFEVVGQVTGKADAPLDGLVGSRAPGERLLLAHGVEGVLRSPLFARLFRTVTWLVPLDPNAFEATRLDDFERRVEQENTRLRLRSPGFGVRAPVEELAAAGEQAERASRRQLLVAGQFIALFVAFAVLAASRIRRDARETQYRLRRFGALRWQVLVEATAHAAVVAVPAALLGWFGGVAAGAVIAAAADRSVSSALERSSLSAFGLQAALGLSVIAVAAIVVTVRARSVEIRGLRVTVADVAAAGAVAVVVAAFGTGQHDAAGTNGTGTLLLLLPVLIAFAGAVVAARLLGPAFRFGEHVAPKTSVAVRLALLSLVRSPGPATLAVVFLVVTAGLAVFAGTYRATLGAHHRDTAAYAVPLEYVVSRDAVRSRGLGAPAPLSGHYGGQRAVGVVRRPGEAPTLNRTERLTVLGIPPAALERLHWRGDYAERSRTELAAAISFGRAAELRGIDIPSGTREVVFPLRVRGEPIQLVAHFRRPNGSFAALELRESRTPSVRTVRLPQGVAGGRLVALTLQFPPATAFTAAHRATGTRAAPDVFVRGMLTLRRPVARGATGVRPLAVDYRDWVQADGSGVGRSPTTLTLRYLLTRERVSRVRPRQVTDERPLPVIASASLAAAAGEGSVLPLDVGGADIRVRLAATADRFPTTRGDFVVAGRDALETALNSAAPGVAVADEVWLEGPGYSETQLRRAAPVPVRVVSRPALEDRLRADPVSRASSLALIAGALVALALALAGILLALAIDLRDEAAELFDLEALGLPPAGLARHVWLRSVAVVLLGIAGGLATGAVIAFVVTDVVEVTSGTESAEPPLLLVTDWPALLAGLVVFTAIALGSAALLARGAFRAAAPARGYLR